MLASLLTTLSYVGLLVGLFVFALVVFGGTRFGGNSGRDSERKRRGEAYSSGVGDDD